MPYNGNDNNLVKAITIDTVDINKGRYKITSTGGTTYSFFERTQNGSMTMPMKAFKEFNLGPGDTVKIVYRETEGEWQGRAVTYRNILAFKSADDSAQEERPQQRQQQAPQQNRPKEVPRQIMVDEERLQSEIIGKTATQFLAAAISAGLSLEKARGEVEQAVMVAEALLFASKGPAREKARRRQPERASATDLAGPWDDERADAGEGDPYV